MANNITSANIVEVVNNTTVNNTNVEVTWDDDAIPCEIPKPKRDILPPTIAVLRSRVATRFMNDVKAYQAGKKNQSVKTINGNVHISLLHSTKYLIIKDGEKSLIVSESTKVLPLCKLVEKRILNGDYDAQILASHEPRAKAAQDRAVREAAEAA